jgi:CRP-like cAMP-binding protein
MTISTIGYGDIVPVTTGERIYVIIAMLVGAFEYGYIVGAVSNIIATRNEKMNRFQGVMRDLNGFLTDHRFPQELRVRLREYFRYQLDRADADVYKMLLSKMSPALRTECTMRMNTWMRRLDFFKKCPEPFVMHLSTLVVEQTYPPEETLFTAGDELSHVYLIRRGVVDVNGRIKVSGKTIAEAALYTEGPVLYDARAVTYTDIYTLARSDFNEALKPYPATRRYFRLQGIKMMFRKEILAFSKAWWALKRLGLKADMSNDINPRPAFYLTKLRMIYGEDGEGLDNPKLLEQKIKAATVIQKRFRGMLHRVLLHKDLVERGVQGIFHKVLRERDPLSYTAHALDVFHWRLAYSLTEVHRKVNALMDAANVNDLPTESAERNTSIKMALQAATGKAMTASRSKPSGMAPASPPPATVTHASTGSPTEAHLSSSRVAGWDATSTDNPVQRLQARVDELTNRLVPLDRKITNYQTKQNAALAETNERLGELAAQLETLLSLTVTNMESGLADAREARETRRAHRRRESLSPPPASEASRRL